MTYYIACANGNLTSSSTWQAVDATSLLDSEAGNTTSTTSYVYTSTFTPGAITVDGLAIKILNRSAATGTLTVELYNNTLASSVTSVTINLSDVQALTSFNHGWYFFKFSASQLLLVANAYKIGVKTSSAGTVGIYRDATAGNWSRMLRTTTTGTPTTNDSMHVLGEWTGAGSQTTRTVTMDQTATTSYGLVAQPQSITIGNGGTMTCATSASTNYNLKWKGVFMVFAGGVLNTGTTGTPMPSTSTLTFTMDSAANVDSGLNISYLGTWNGRGNALTYVKALLTANASAAATSLTSSVSTGWKNGDLIALASTSRTSTESETKALTADASGTTLTITALTNAHNGTSPTQAEIANLTRNIKLVGTSGTLQGYVVFQTTATIDVQYIEFVNMGSSTSSKRGIDFLTTSGTVNIQYCSMRSFDVSSSTVALFTNTPATNSVTFSNNNVYMTATNTVVINYSGTNNITFDNNLFILSGSPTGFTGAALNFTFTNNTIVGGGTFVSLTGQNPWTGTFSGNTFHSGAASFSINQKSGTFSNTTIWRANSSAAIIIGAGTCNITLDGLTMFGNLTTHINIGSAMNLTINNGLFASDTTFTTSQGLTQNSNTVSSEVYFSNCTFGVVSGIFRNHTNDLAGLAAAWSSWIFYNCTFTSNPIVANQTFMPIGSFFSMQRLNTTAGNHKAYFSTGTIAIDTVIYDVSPSLRMTPNSASLKLPSSPNSARDINVRVASGSTATISAKVRESVIGDGTAYNGSRIRMICRKNVGAGIASDTVLATATVASVGAFETISGTTPAITDDAVLGIYFDCDGTTGWVNIDTVTAV